MLQRISRILEQRGAGGTAVMVADRIIRPLGLSLISFTRLAAIPPAPREVSAEDRFDRIAEGNLWGSNESLSGAGSEVARTDGYRAALVRMLREKRIRTLFDAPCGDLNWMPFVLDQLDVEYIGGDISPSLIELNRKRFPKLSFEQFDITKDEFPQADVWHCRDCLFHLSYRDIELAFRNFARSKIPFALITNHAGIIRNVDIESGGWRYIDLRRAPFNLPPPQEKLNDYKFGDLPRYVGLWSREQIEQALLSTGSA